MRTAVLFDVEGTLVDCVDETVQAWQEALRDAGFDFALEEIHPHAGQDGRDMLRALLPREAAQEFSAVLMKTQGDLYRYKYLNAVRAFSGVRPLLERIKTEGHAVALATTCARDELRHYRTLIDANDLVDAVACGDDVKHDKPDPALLNIAIDRLGIRPRAFCQVRAITSGVWTSTRT
jgi:beta-phosphoglucomutase-like phosphatase (HAD superfamily)